MMGENTDGFGRRTYLKATGTVAAASVFTLAGCAGDDGDGEEELEVAHWWTAGGEEDAIEALLEGFEAEYDFEVNNNPTPGGAGSALEAEIRNRVIDGNPPSTFQIWPGQALTPYTEEGLLEDIGESVWDDEMREAYLDGPMEAAQPEGELVAVPINIHRLNNLFYNVEVVEEAGVDPAGLETPEDLLGALETVDAAGMTGMAHQTQEPWSTLQLWEGVLLAQGEDAYTQFIEGEVEAVEQEVRNSLELVAEYFGYLNEDASSVAWDEANGYLINGEAAFMHQGDWAAGQYEAEEGFEFEEDWNHVPFPGTDGLYQIVMDSFVYPTNNPSPEATEAFLDYAGTVDAQERFNIPKGSIPPRTDVPTDEFTAFLQRQSEEFEASESQPPQIAHGLAVPPGQQSDIEGVFANFNETGDVDDAYQSLVGVFD